MTPNQSQKPTQLLIEELVAALYLRPWIDEAEDRYKLRKEIIKRVRSGESSLTLLLRLFNHPDWAVRRDAIEMLGWIGNADAIQPLLKILWKDESKAVRGSAALALKRIGGPEASAAYQEYNVTIRSYPELVGSITEMAEREGISEQEIFDMALQNQNYGILIKDNIETVQGALLSFDLCDILAAIGKQARLSQWCCRGVKCIGEYASEMHGLSDRGLIVSGRTFAHIALMLDQTIDGEFVAFRGNKEPWLVIRAVDSSWFEVWSSNLQVLEKIKGHFRCIEDIESDCTYR